MSQIPFTHTHTWSIECIRMHCPYKHLAYTHMVHTRVVYWFLRILVWIIMCMWLTGGSAEYLHRDKISKQGVKGVHGTRRHRRSRSRTGRCQDFSTQKEDVSSKVRTGVYIDYADAMTYTHMHTQVDGLIMWLLYPLAGPASARHTRAQKPLVRDSKILFLWETARGSVWTTRETYEYVCYSVRGIISACGISGGFRV